MIIRSFLEQLRPPSLPVLERIDGCSSLEDGLWQLAVVEPGVSPSSSPSNTYASHSAVFFSQAQTADDVISQDGTAMRRGLYRHSESNNGHRGTVLPSDAVHCVVNRMIPEILAGVA